MEKNHNGILKNIISVITIVVAVIVGSQVGHLITGFLLDKTYTVEDINKEFENMSIDDLNLPDFIKNNVVEMKGHMNDNHELTFKIVFKDITAETFSVNSARIGMGDGPCKASEKFGKLMKRDDIVMIYQYYTTNEKLIGELKYNKYGYINENNEVEKVLQDKNKLLEQINTDLTKLAESMQNNANNASIETIKIRINNDYDIIFEETLKYGYYVNDYNQIKKVGEEMAKYLCTYCNQVFQTDKTNFFLRVYTNDKKLLKEFMYDANGFIG